MIDRPFDLIASPILLDFCPASTTLAPSSKESQGLRSPYPLPFSKKPTSAFGKKANIATHSVNVRIRGQSGHEASLRECPLISRRESTSQPDCFIAAANLGQRFSMGLISNGSYSA